jgi:ABC-type glycerol-3-phosphate transport system permease component
MVVLYLMVAAVVVWSVFPIYTEVRLSVMDQREAVLTPMHWIPQQPTLDWYGRILALVPDATTGKMLAFADTFKQGFLNSFLVACVVTLVSVVVGSMAAYAFARFSFRRKNAWLMSILLSRSLPAAAMAIPFFFMFHQVGLIGTYQGLIITYLSFEIPLATWILMGYFANLPLETERAGRIDGLGRLGVLFRVVIPEAIGGVASVGILLFLISWSEFFFAYILTAGSAAQTVPAAVSEVSSNLVAMVIPQETAACVVITLIPALVLGTIFQKYILRLKIVDPVATRVGEEIPFA